MNFQPIHRAVLLTDIVNSAGLAAQWGDLKFSRVMSELEALIRETIRKHNGLEIDKTDGFLVVFQSAEDALSAALSLSQGVEDFAAARKITLKMRTGLHYGTLIQRRNAPEDVARGAKTTEVDGITKIIAARVAALAEPGQVLLTRDVFNMTREAAPVGKDAHGDVQWLAHGPYMLQGIHDPVEVFEAGAPGKAPLAPPRDQSKAQRAVLPQDELTLGWRPASGQVIPTAPDWKLLKKLGEGGYGEVWLAEDPAGGRQVFKFCFNARRLRSLKREVFLLNLIQENLGRRDDIVDIVNWNVNEPPFYLALQYESADNLSTWFEEHRGADPLPEDTILSIVRQTAVALVAAHSIGVLHKDIKPSNLLVNEAGQGLRIQLIDFGVGLYAAAEQAQLAAELGVSFSGASGATLRTSSISGTRMYIAPELLEGKVPTVQADVFSVGVLLYQLLANDLQTGLKVGWEREVECLHLRQLVASATDGNLETRIQSAAGLVERIDGLKQEREAARLEDERLVQEAEGRRRIEYLERRRKTYAAALLVAIPLLLVAVVLAMTAYQARSRAEHQTKLATNARDKLDGLVSFMLEDLGKELKKIGRLQVLNSVVTKSVEHFADESTVTMSKQGLYNRSVALLNIGNIHYQQNQFQEWKKATTQSLAIARRLEELYPNDPKITGLLLDARQQAAVKSEMPRKEAIVELQDIAWAWEQIYDATPTDVKVATKLANTYSNIAIISNDPNVKFDYAKKSYNLRNKVASLDDEKGLETKAYNESFMAYYEKWDNSISHCRKAASLYEALLQSEPSNITLRSSAAKNNYHLASLLTSPTGDNVEAERLYDLVITDYQELLNRDPLNVHWKLDCASALLSSGQFKKRKGDITGAIERVSQSSDLFESVHVFNPGDSVVERAMAVRSELAMMYAFTGKQELCEKILKDQLLIQEARLKVCSFCDIHADRYLNDSANFALRSYDPSVLRDAISFVRARWEHLRNPKQMEINIRMSEKLLESAWLKDNRVPQWLDLTSSGTKYTVTIVNDTEAVHVLNHFCRDEPTAVHRAFLGRKGGAMNVSFFSQDQGVSINGSRIIPIGTLSADVGTSTTVSDFFERYGPAGSPLNAVPTETDMQLSRH